MCFLKSRFSWLAAPAIWLTALLILVAVWASATPEWSRNHFDQDGGSPVELATVTLFFAQIGLMWLVSPVPANKYRSLLLADFSLLTLFAICRELDWHRLLITPSALSGATHGTPFKMRFLTNANNPLADRILVALCFVLVIGLCGGTLLYFLRRLIKGLSTLHPVCWSVGFLGGTALLSQIADRMPAVFRKEFGIHFTDSQRALMTVLEEGQELLLPVFVILALLQAHFIYNSDPADRFPLARHKAL